MNEDATKQRRARIVSWAVNLGGVLAFVLILYLGGIEAWEQILGADWRYLLAALGVAITWNLVATYRWALIAEEVVAGAERCPFRYYFTYHMIGMVTGQVLPITVGMLGGRPVALSLSRGVSIRRAGLSVLIDKLFDLLLALLLVVPVALYLVGWIDLRLATGLIVGVIVAGAVIVRLYYEQAMKLAGRFVSRLVRPVARVPLLGARLARLPEQLDRLAAETPVSNRLAVQSFLLTVLMYGILSTRLYCISQALRLQIPWYLLAMGLAVTQLTVIFAVTPGSLGFLEGGWGAVLGLAGLSSEQFLVFVIGRRAIVLVLMLIGALLAFAWIRESPARLFRAVIVASRGQKEMPTAAVK